GRVSAARHARGTPQRQPGRRAPVPAQRTFPALRPRPRPVLVPPAQGARPGELDRLAGQWPPRAPGAVLGAPAATLTGRLPSRPADAGTPPGARTRPARLRRRPSRPQD